LKQPWLAIVPAAFVGIPVSGAVPHPSTVFDTAELAHLQAARGDDSRRTLVEAMQATLRRQGDRFPSPGGAGDPRLFGNSLAGLAMAAAVLNREDTRRLAARTLDAALGLGDWGFGEGDDLNRAHLLVGASIAYDVLWPGLDDAARRRARDRIASEASRMAEAFNRRIWWATDYLQNHNWIDTAAFGLAGLALEGETARAADWAEVARRNAETIRPALDLVSDGSWHEGIGYQQYGWSMAMPWWLASRRRGHDPSDNATLRAYGRYRLHVQLPDEPRGYVLTHGDWSGWAGPGSAQVLRYAASRFGDGSAQTAAGLWSDGGARSTALWDLYYLALEYIVFDPEVPESSRAAEPLDLRLPDQGAAVLRSGWAPGAAVVALKSGVMGGAGNFARVRDGGPPGPWLNVGHDHADDLGLWIYGNGTWLLPECPGYGPEGARTDRHNTILVDGEGQLGERRQGDDASTNDWFFRRIGSLGPVSSTCHYAFARAEGAGLYREGLGVTGLSRFVALSREGRIVLRDEAQARGARTFEQLFHFSESARVVDGGVSGIAADGSSLALRIVAPPDWRADFSRQSAPKLSKDFDDDGSVELVRVRAARASARQVFLEVLEAAPDDAMPAPVRPLFTDTPEAGLEIARRDGTETWVFSDQDIVRIGDLAVSGSPAVVLRDASGAIRRAVIVGPGRVEAGGRVLLESPDEGAVEAEWSGSVVSVSGAARPELRVWAPPGASIVVTRGDGTATAVAGAAFGENGASWSEPTRAGCSSGVEDLLLALPVLAWAWRRLRRRQGHDIQYKEHSPGCSSRQTRLVVRTGAPPSPPTPLHTGQIGTAPFDRKAARWRGEGCRSWIRRREYSRSHAVRSHLGRTIRRGLLPSPPGRKHAGSSVAHRGPCGEGVGG